MKVKIIAFFVTLLFVSASVVAQKQMTLQQCIDSALSANRKIKQQEIAHKSKEIEYKQAKQNLLPDLSASAGQNYTLGRSLTADNTYKSVNSNRTFFSISSGITLFDGLKMKYEIDAKLADMKATEADLEKVKEDIKLNVTVAFLQVLLYKENMQTVRNQIDLTQQKIDQKTILVNEGKVAEGELLELKSQKAKEELNLVQAMNNYRLSLLELAQIIEINDYHQLDVIATAELTNAEPVLLSAEDVYQSALLNRPEIRSASYRLQSSKMNVDIAKSAYFPTLEFGAQTGSGYFKLSGVPNDSFGQQFNDNLSTVLGFSLRVPIFNRFATQNRVAASRLAVENSKLEMENTRLELQKTIEQSYQSALAAKAKYLAAQKSLVSSEEAYRYAELKYEAGKASVYELYQAKASLLQVQSELTQSKYEFILRVKALELLK